MAETPHGLLIGTRSAPADEGLSYGLIGPARPYTPVLGPVSAVAVEGDRLATVDNPDLLDDGKSMLRMLRLRPDGSVEQLARQELPWRAAWAAALRGDQVVLFAEANGPEAWLWEPGKGVRQLPFSAKSMTIQHGGDLVAGVGLTDDCLAVARLSEPAKQLWHSCDGHHFGYLAPSGDHLLALRNDRGAIADVVALDSGQIESRVRFPPKVSSWPKAWEEDDRHYLIEAWTDPADPHARAFVLRCDTGSGECERVLDLTGKSFCTPA